MTKAEKKANKWKSISVRPNHHDKIRRLRSLYERAEVDLVHDSVSLEDAVMRAVESELRRLEAQP